MEKYQLFRSAIIALVVLGLKAACSDPSSTDPCDPNPCTALNQICEVEQGAAVCRCAPGYHDNQGTCVEDITCGLNTCNGHGNCNASTGWPVCTCEAEYTGTNCESCAQGYHWNGAHTACTQDPCDPNPCAEPHNGQCTENGGAAACSCDPGYHDVSGTCVLDTLCETNTCNGHGTCDDTGGAAACTCEDEYAGDRCAACAEGYVHWPEGDLNCVDDPCVPDPCAGLDHTEDGACAQTGTAEFECRCEAGYQWDGTVCTVLVCPDADEDGFEDQACGGNDCDDGNPLVNPNAAEDCDDGLDNDCDGQFDQEDPDCALGCVDPDGDGYGEGQECRGPDCEPNDAVINPDATERCDGVDNDCDSETDEGFAVGLNCDGDDGDMCQNGTFTCSEGGQEVECVNETVTDILEVCDGADNDCDVVIDEGFPDADGDGQADCIDPDDDGDGDPDTTDCAPLDPDISHGITEKCDGVDNNCDVAIDEGFAVGQSCDGDDGDMCQNGTFTCSGDGQEVECVNETVTDILEVCDGADNDCDQATDEGFANSDGDSQADCVDPDDDNDGIPDESDCAPLDPAIYPGSSDDPDDGYLDSNCDGIDGDESRAIFVSVAGSDSWPGTKSAPKRTIQTGIDYANATAHPHVYVAKGNYSEIVTLINGVSVFGGYDPTDWRRNTTTNVVNLSGSSVAMYANSITQATRIDGLTVTSLTATTSGQSSYALISKSSTVALSFHNVAFQAGAGARGADGQSGITGADGVKGSDGAPGCENSSIGCDTCSKPSEGQGATSSCFENNAWNTYKGGDGGAPGLGGNNGFAGQPGTRDGSAVTPGGLEGTSSSGCPTCDQECYSYPNPRPDVCQGAPGSGGANGSSGPGGAGGLGFGFVDGTNLFLPSDGQDGTAGQAGYPGGGGGGGAGGDYACDSYGSAGGGGGTGGCGGTPGMAGKGGGASIAVFLWNSSPTFSNCTIATSDGGSGGDGKTGGPGGQGGMGGLAHYGFGSGSCSDQDDGGCGGYGGRGGNGGQGGGGGGGGGGPSIGIIKGGASSPTLNSLNYSIGSGGIRGFGGGSGNDGSNGMRQQVWP